MRARSARGVQSAPVAALLVHSLLAMCLVLLTLGAAQSLTAEPAAGMARRIDAASLAELRRLREVAKDAPANEREARWYDVAQFALEHASSIGDQPIPDESELASALREACSRLPATALAAVSVRGAHPAVSAAFCRALGKERGPNGVTGAAEAAAEARDAIAAFGGGEEAKPFLELLRDDVAAAVGAGGAQRSVYSILVLGADRDSASTEFRVARGLVAGVEAAAGAWATRFQVRVHGTGEVDAGGAAWITRLALRDFPRSAVIVSAGNSAAWTAASALGMAEGLVTIDARGPSDVGPEDAWAFGDSFAQVPPHRAGEATSRARLLGFTPELAYRPAGEAAKWFLRPVLVRPTPTERARRLAEVVSRRPEVKRIAVALPEIGGDLVFASSFLAAMGSLGRETEILIYAPGRRDYAPEAARFVATGAQAILLAGPGEESAEWLGALAVKRAKPLVLGTSELDPAGFHVGQRARLEGAILAGEDWEDRNTSLVERIQRTAGEDADDPAYRRGYRLGWVLARAVVEGAYTPTSLRLALEQRSLPKTMATFTSVLVGIDKTGATVPTELVLPLFTVMNGARVPFELR